MDLMNFHDLKLQSNQLQRIWTVSPISFSIQFHFHVGFVGVWTWTCFVWLRKMKSDREWLVTDEDGNYDDKDECNESSDRTSDDNTEVT